MTPSPEQDRQKPLPPPVADTSTQGIPDWVRSLTRWLDDAFRVPGTPFRIGLDGIVGFFLPGLGDVLTGLSALSLLWVGVRLRVPAVVLMRMALNLLIDTLVGALPILGDAFDFAWKANRKNLALLERYEHTSQRKAKASDYVLVGFACLFVVASIVLPLIVLVALTAALLAHFRR